MSFLKLLTLYDKILIAFIIILSLITIFLYPILMVKETSADKYAVIKIDYKEIYRYELDGSKRIEKFSFKVNGKDYTGRLEIDGDRVRLYRLSKEILPLSIHADTGWIDKSYQMIVALPIKLTVQIESLMSIEPEFDGISY